MGSTDGNVVLLFFNFKKSLQVFLASVDRTYCNFSLQSTKPGDHRPAEPGSLSGQEEDPQLSKDQCCPVPQLGTGKGLA